MQSVNYFFNEVLGAVVVVMVFAILVTLTTLAMHIVLRRLVGAHEPCDITQIKSPTCH